ncbi:hypothetical protein EON65_07480 [archaeon]|nr:MAG: hypothetical protein EON65_07480 [archaeon]
MHFFGCRRENAPDIVTSFPFSEEEFVWAWSNYSDACGPMLRMENCMFRRCKCVDAKTNLSKPCVPPMVGYLCTRQCFMLKRRLVRQRDKAERVWFAYKECSMNDAVKRSEYDAKDYLASNEGKKWLDNTAYDQAEEQLLDNNVSSIVERRIQKAEKYKQTVILRFNKQIKDIERIRDVKVATLKDELSKLKDARKVTPEGYMRDVLEQRIDQKTAELANLPENNALVLLNRQCEDEVKIIEEDLYSSSDDDGSSAYGSDVSSLYDSDDSTEDAVAYRKRRDRFQKKKRENEQLKTFAEQFRPGEFREQNKAAGKKADALDGMKVIYKGVKKGMDGVSAYIHNKTHKPVKKAKKFARDVVELNMLRYQKYINKLSGGFDELQKQIRAELYRQYIEHQVFIAKEKVRREFSVIEKG